MSPVRVTKVICPACEGSGYRKMVPRISCGLCRGARRVTPALARRDAREEFTAAYGACDCDVERARRMIVRSFMGFGSTGALGRSTGFRAGVTRSGTTPAHDWAGYPMALIDIVSRLAGVVIESGDALGVMRRHDSSATLHYVDPPYVHETRSVGNPYCAKHKYRHEMSDGAHSTLLEALRGLEGMVVLSGYAHALYDDVLSDWYRVEREALADGARPRTEVLWLNPACRASLEAARMPLFASGGARATGKAVADDAA